MILDGAKRDRRPWSGDLSVEGRNAFDSLGLGVKIDCPLAKLLANIVSHRNSLQLATPLGHGPKLSCVHGTRAFLRPSPH